jgi:ribosomal protein S27AE
MLKAAIRNARYFYTKAITARERALGTKNPEDRVSYFEAEARWLELAESYEVSTRTSQFIASQPATPQRPSCPACAQAMPLAEVQVFRGAIEYRYACKACGYRMDVTRYDDRWTRGLSDMV